ncbi:MAG: DegT/DnrJ/EryC1/StrS family aminotransferase [Candidatus Solibacter usitatus]|nr:DegT/DnrJ/EryC1/StrS family aminotransferase [Candidatus Solibacter usitatus]
MRRRNFLAAPLGAGLLAAAEGEGADRQIMATGDGIPHSPREYASLLAKLSEHTRADSYSLGGVIEKLEQSVAAALGKEYAVWMPTGTLANHLAMRMLAGERRRVIVQAECHLYNDCGDCAQTLSGLNMIPLGAGRATFTLEEVESAASRAALGRVTTPIGAIQIESPVRRRTGEQFRFAEMKRICGWARERKIGLHLDGARLFLESAYTGISVKEYAAQFDTVYISMYKYFNAASGAVLAGPKILLENAYNIRRMFGGGVNHSWPAAAVALHFFDGFETRFRQAVKTSEAVLKALSSDSNFEVRRIENGTNIAMMRVRGVNAPVYRQRLELAGITIGAPENEWFRVQVNETWNRRQAEEITARFRKALG